METLAFHYDSIDSTSDQARRLAAKHPGRRLLVTATTQTQGRGRSGRSWRSPPGGAWLTVTWPTTAPPEHYRPTPLLVGEAVLTAITDTTTIDGQLLIKWPNDILLDNQKVAGVLCELDMTNDPPLLFAGVGINANFLPDALGDDLRRTPTTLLAATGRPVDLPTLIQHTTERIQAALGALDTPDQTQNFIERINQHLAWIGHTITVTRGRDAVRGVLKGVEPDGRLRLEADRQTHLLDAGEVQEVTPGPAGAATG